MKAFYIFFPVLKFKFTEKVVKDPYLKTLSNKLEFVKTIIIFIAVQKISSFSNMSFVISLRPKFSLMMKIDDSVLLVLFKNQAKNKEKRKKAFQRMKSTRQRVTLKRRRHQQ